MLTDAQFTKLWHEIQALDDIQPATLEEVAAIEADYVPVEQTPEEIERDYQLFREWWDAVQSEL